MQNESIDVIRLRGAKSAFFAELPRGKEFKSAVEEAPFLIRSLGLGSGIATLVAKGGQRQTLAKMLCKWLVCECVHSPWYGTAKCNDDWVQMVLDKIANGDQKSYRLAQIEAMGYVGWIKRLAQAYCEVSD